MTKERLTLRKIREILRLKEESNLSNRVIARACKISNRTVGEYLMRAQTAGLYWPLPEGLSEDELYQKLFTDSSNASTPDRHLPDWEKVRKELKEKGVLIVRKEVFNLSGYTNNVALRAQYCCGGRGS
jgi:transposase